LKKELWTDQDKQHLLHFGEAIHQEDVLDACLAIEGANEETKERSHSYCRVWSTKVCQRQEPEAFERLRRVLGEELGFQGNTEDYYHASNSHLSHVIETRQGLPILLSVLWMHVGQLADISVHGVGLPGHFIVRTTEADGTFAYVDPFRSGQRLTKQDAQVLVENLYKGKLQWEESFLNVVPTNCIIERILRNLLNTHAMRKQPHALYRTLRFYQRLRPERPETYVQCGNIAAALDTIPLALESFRTFVALFPNHPAIDQVIDTVDTLTRQIGYVH
jgi:regulator of sirC expression with transglutaminase-like and TPR domain